MCVLRAGGSEFDVDAFLATSSFNVIRVHRKGEPRFTTRPDGPRKEGSGFNADVSSKEWDDLPGQCDDAKAFLSRYEAELLHGGKASGAFHLVIPSIPGYGYSGKPSSINDGWDPVKIAWAWVVLMKRLGYSEFVAQGGDWGAVITEQMGLLAPPRCSAFTPTCPACFRTTSTTRPSPEPRRHRVCQPTRNSLMSGCSSYIKRASDTVTSWDCARRPCTESRIHRSAWRPISLITTRAAMRSSRASSTDSLRGSRATTSSTTSRSPG